MSLQQWPVCAAALQGGETTATGGGLTAKVRLQCAWCWCWCLDQVIHPNTVQHCRHGDTPTTLQRWRWIYGRDSGELTVIMLQTGGQLTTCNTFTIMEIETYPTDIFLNRIQ